MKQRLWCVEWRGEWTAICLEDRHTDTIHKKCVQNLHPPPQLTSLWFSHVFLSSDGGILLTPRVQVQKNFEGKKMNGQKTQKIGKLIVINKKFKVDETEMNEINKQIDELSENIILDI
jgi:lipopolysaccharide biosynthesis protein